MIYLQLFWIFFKIGILGFGGGYAIIPMIGKDLGNLGWLSATDFANVVAISQMTPGPLAVNAATFVGYRVAGVFGSAVATFGVTLPSFILVIAVSLFLEKFKSNRIIQGIFQGIRPVTVGMMASAALFFIELSFLVITPAFSFHAGLFFIFLLSILLTIKYKWNPILVILLSMAFGLILA